MSLVLLVHRRGVACIVRFAISNPIFHFISNYLGSRVYFLPFAVCIEDNLRFMNPPYAVRYTISSLKLTGFNDLYITLKTIKFILLGSFNTPTSSFVDFSYSWYVVSHAFHPSCIGVSSHIRFVLYSSIFLSASDMVDKIFSHQVSTVVVIHVD